MKISAFQGRAIFVVLAIAFIAAITPQTERRAEVQKGSEIDEELLRQPIYEQQLDAAKAEIIEKAKYYRSIGEHEKAAELFRSLKSNLGQISPVDKGLEKIDQVTVTREDPAEQKKGVSILWDTTDNPVSTSSNHERYPYLEARYNSTNDSEIYHVCERWSGSTAPDRIRLTRSMNHGNDWYEAYALDNGTYELTAPQIKQVANYYMGVVFVRKFSSSDYDIHFWRPKVTDFNEYSYTFPDNSSGTKDVGPQMATDYLDFPDGAFVYIAYFRLGSSPELRFVRSLDAGQTWEDSISLWVLPESEPLNANTCASIAYETTNNTLWIAFTYPYAGKYRLRVLKSSNFGETWSYVNYFDSPLPILNLSITAKSSYEAWVVYNVDYVTDRDTYVLYTSDGGSTWATSSIEGTSAQDSNYAKIRYISGSSYVYVGVLVYPNEVWVDRASISTPTSWVALGNVKNSTNTLTQDPVAILVSQNPSGTYQGSVSWVHQYTSTDYDVYFDAEWLPVATSTKMAVVPTTNFDSSGQQGGPFSPSAMDYLVENTGTQSVSYTVTVNQSWVTLSNTGGTLSGGNAATVEVSINSNANSLAPGTYTATVTFTNTTNGVGNTTRTVTLTVAATTGVLTVTPTYGYIWSMFRGGPVPGGTGPYTLQNTGGTSINWQATKTKIWLTISSPTSGSLAPSESTTKTLSINSNCLSLTEGSHYDTVTFTNTTNGNGNTTRSVTLDVVYNQFFTVRGADNRIYQREMTTAGGLTPWRFLIGLTNKAPATGIFNNRLHIFVKSDINNDIWYNYVNPNAGRTMGSWTKIDGLTPDRPAVAVFNNRLYVVVRGTDNKIYIRYMDSGGTFSAWSVVPGGWTTVAPAIAAFNNYLYLIVKDANDNKIWWNKMDIAGVWSGWRLMDGLSPSTAAMTEFNGLLYIVVRGADDRIYYRSMNTAEVFTSWGWIPGFTNDSPAICSFNNRLYLVVKSNVGNEIYYNYMTLAGVWGTFSMMDGLSPTTAALSAPKID
jgi:hypothetical protein